MTATDNDLVARLLAFLDSSPSPWHATREMTRRLDDAGFVRLVEHDAWQLEGGGAYYVTRNDSSLIAFRLGDDSPVETGFRMVGAHTDSPCLRVKPNPIITSDGYLQLAVETYGGVLLNPWFDRDLSLAGRVTVRSADGQLHSTLIDFGEPIGVIPSLAIHLDREANDSRSINKQTYLPVVLALAGDGEPEFASLIGEQLAREHPGLGDAAIMDFELCFYDVNGAALVGLKHEFIAAARLDNLLSCFVGLEALLNAGPGVNPLLVCNDHEEIGSGTAAGARGTFLRSVAERLSHSAHGAPAAGEHLARAMSRSILVSTDNAHGIHPNFADRHDSNHGPLLGGGPALKVNANQAYASNSETAAVFRAACEDAGVPLQAFVSRSDMGCGSTIGPITATALGIPTVDVGVPTFAMHSIRELAGTADPAYLYRALRQFFTR
ncbi:MAG: M18 family aminopeptidase [Gammaproteobacteria bacterium]|nr:M18 family aminopeptidase [Gammaproteobacteria bacterium]